MPFVQYKGAKKLLLILAFVLVCSGCFLFLQNRETPEWFPFQEATPHQKIDLFFTVDVETPSHTEQWHPYDDHALFIEGDGSPKTPTMNYIMSALEKYHLKGNFFLDIYEYKRFKKTDTMQHIAQEMSKRGHEVDLHCHADRLTGKNLIAFSATEQEQLLSKGKALIQTWTGKAPIAFRAGGYLLNDDTFLALQRIGIPIDSSVFYGNSHNQFKSFTHNSVTIHKGIIEIPITSARHEHRAGLTKFDLNWIGYNGFKKIIKQAKQTQQKKLVFMMHSSSLLKFDRNKPYQPLEVNTAKLEQLNKILEYIAQDPDLHVITYQEWYRQNRHNAHLNQYEPEFLPVVK